MAHGIATRRSPIFGAIAAVVGLTLPLLFFAEPADSSLAASGLWLLNAVILIWASVRLGIILSDSEIRPLIAMYWLFIYIAMAVVPMAQLHVGQWGRLADPSHLVTAQTMTLVGAIALDLGYVLRNSRHTSSPPPAGGSSLKRVVTLGRLRALSLASLALSTFYISTIGSVGIFFESRYDRSVAIRTAELGEGLALSSIISSLGTIPTFISLLLWSIMLLQRPDLRRTVEPWIWVVVSASINTIVNNPITNPRFWVLTMALGFLFSLPRLNPGKFRAIIVTGIIFALVAFPYTDYFRASDQFRGQINVRSVAETIATKDFDQSPMTANGVWWVDTVGHTLGTQILGSLFFFVPRSVWPDKSVDTGVAIGTAMNASNTNLSSPLWLEVWVDFSWPGLVVAFILLGALMRFCDDTFSELRPRMLTTKSVYLGSFMLPVIAGYSLIILRGPLLQSMARLAVVVIVCYLVTSRVQSTSRTGARTRQTIR